MFDRREPTNTEKYRREHPKKVGTSCHRPSPITCHFCGQSWDSRWGCFVCPKCHTVFDPFRGGVGLGGELRVARVRVGTSLAELAKIIDCSVYTLQEIEHGRGLESNSSKGKLIRERLRIWIEDTKSPIDKRKEIDEMFNTTGQNNQKENE